jgi:hypothetical protein
MAALPIPLAPEQLRAKALPRHRMRMPRRVEGRFRAADIFAAMLVARGIPNSEIAECLGGGERMVRQMRSGEVAVGVGDIFALPRRLALHFLDALRLALLTEGHE